METFMGFSVKIISSICRVLFCIYYGFREKKRHFCLSRAITLPGRHLQIQPNYQRQKVSLTFLLDKIPQGTSLSTFMKICQVVSEKVFEEKFTDADGGCKMMAIGHIGYILYTRSYVGSI